MAYLTFLKLHTDMARRKELRNEWYRVSDRMMIALRDAAMKCAELTEKTEDEMEDLHDP